TCVRIEGPRLVAVPLGRSAHRGERPSQPGDQSDPRKCLGVSALSALRIPASGSKERWPKRPALRDAFGLVAVWLSRTSRCRRNRKKAKGQPHQQKLKEICVRPKTGDHDVDTKVSQARKFLEHKDRVQVYVIFRGRELQHMAEGQRVLDLVLEKLADVGKVERPPLMEGKRLVATLAPR